MSSFFLFIIPSQKNMHHISVIWDLIVKFRHCVHHDSCRRYVRILTALRINRWKLPRASHPFGQPSANQRGYRRKENANPDPAGSTELNVRFVKPPWHRGGKVIHEKGLLWSFFCIMFQNISDINWSASRKKLFVRVISTEKFKMSLNNSNKKLLKRSQCKDLGFRSNQSK
jgi:hypothetical protein